MVWFLVSVALAAPDTVLAVVNGTSITQADLDRTIAEVANPALTDGREAEFLEKLITIRIVADLAAKARLAETDTGRAVLADAEQQALAQLAVNAMLAERLTPAAIKTWYDAHLVQFKRPQVKARHILVKEKAEAADILALLKKGGDFGTLAKERSVDLGSGREGGELGWFEKSRMVEEFAEAAFGAKPGTVVGPVQSKFGWHVIAVDALRESIPLEEVEPKIRSELSQEILAAWLEEVRASAQVTIPGAVEAPLLTPITMPPVIPTDAPRAGSRSPRVQLVAFVDVQCPMCRDMHERIDALVAGRADVGAAYLHYPIASACNPNVERVGHAAACDAAKAIVCAGERRDSIASQLFANGEALDSKMVADIAGGGKSWATCMGSPETAARLKADIEAGVTMGIEGTPTVFVGAGGKWWRFEGGAADLERAIAQASG